MRENLFRGKKCKTSVFDETEWVYGSLIDSGNHEQVAIYPWFDGASTMSVRQLVYARMEGVKPETVGQFTGLTDKNGTKVFEGDILQSWSDYRKNYYYQGVVRYGEFNCSCCDGVYGWYLDGGDIRNIDSYEVCGNIHDNPELLEAGHV